MPDNRNFKMKNQTIPPVIFWIDLFCGAGGTTTGIFLSNANAKVVACVNHDAEAIKCHKKNHPECLHLTEDVRDFNVVLKLKNLVEKLRRENPGCFINIWASLECTHFSKAKGGMSRDADSRTLAMHLYKYIEQLDPDYVYIENVMEFRTWGPTMQQFKIENGKKLYKASHKHKKSKVIWLDVPYDTNKRHYNNRKLNSWEVPDKSRFSEFYNKWVHETCFYGFEYDWRKINSADLGAYTSRERYFGVFAKTGLPVNFPKQTHAKKGKHKELDLEPWLPVKDVLNLEEHGHSIFEKNKNGKHYSPNTMERVYYGLQKHSKEGVFIKRYNGGNPKDKNSSINSPLGTILTNKTHSAVFLTSYYGNGGAHSANEPCNTITTKDRFAAHFVHYDYGNATSSSIEKPAGSITSNPKHKLVTSQFTMDCQYANNARSIDRPGQTLIARMDKSPVYLISAAKKDVIEQIKIKKSDSEIVKKIKLFMIENGILYVKIRSLFVEELKRIQGFPDDFELTGTKTNQLKFIGNSVVPLVAQKLVESNYESLVNFYRQIA